MSMSRRCDILKCVDGLWYLRLGNKEYAHALRDCTVYGPFPSATRADIYLHNNFSNPGAVNIDDSGQASVPAEYYSVTKARYIKRNS